MTAAKVTLVDYGSGNILSVKRALEFNGATVCVTGEPAAVEAAERLVLPGVGAFGDCMQGLVDRKLVSALRAFIASGRPFLGICVGMQVLLERSYEFGVHEGLGIIPGEVVPIPKTAASGAPHKIPHIGWTALARPGEAAASYWAGSILEGTEPDTPFYFVHSMTAVPVHASHRLADSDYNGRLVSAAVRSDNVTGVQFHPEKSAAAGLRLLGTFLRL